MAKIDAIDVPKLIFPEAAAPSTPASAKVIIYAKSDGLMYSKDDAGTETVMSGGGGGSGALTLLEQHTASSSATLDFTTFISSTYDSYMIDVVEIAPASNAVNLLMQVGSGGGPTYDTGNNYEYVFNGRTTNGAASTFEGSATTCVLTAPLSNNAGYGMVNLNVSAKGLQSTSHRKIFMGTMECVTSTPSNIAGTLHFNWLTTGTAVTALRFLMSSGNIASGTIRIYGLAK
jgi:hypothetical protein